VVVADPSGELLRLVTGPGDPPPSAATPAELAAAQLLRRRFGLALPPPFAAPSAEEPVRVATPHDGAAIAAIKWRTFGTSYRGGVLDDRFLDERDIVPPASYWTGRAMVPPSRRHRLLVWGRPGTVFGYLDAGPVHPDDADPAQPGAGEVFELYVDPTAQGSGGGARLLDAAEAFFASVGWRRGELNALQTNPGAQAFYARRGWSPTGRVVHVDLGSVAFDEVRFAKPIGPVPP
jgi:GNAT superfamily N-acetyltransferase